MSLGHVVNFEEPAPDVSVPTPLNAMARTAGKIHPQQGVLLTVQLRPYTLIFMHKMREYVVYGSHGYGCRVIQFVHFGVLARNHVPRTPVIRSQDCMLNVCCAVNNTVKLVGLICCDVRHVSCCACAV